MAGGRRTRCVAARLDQASPIRPRRPDVSSKRFARALARSGKPQRDRERTKPAAGVGNCASVRGSHDAEYVWLVGGRPLLVGWGHERADVVPLESAALALNYSRPIAKAAPRPATALTELNRPATVRIARAPPLGGATRDFIVVPATFLWLLFIGLALTIGGLLLPACSIQLPGTQWRLNSLAGCVAHAQNPLSALVAHKIAPSNRLCAPSKSRCNRATFVRLLVRSWLRRDPMFPACHRVLMSKLRFKCALTGTATMISTWSSNVRPVGGSRRYANTYGTKVVATAGGTSMQITR